jgi:hypothetical protein
MLANFQSWYPAMENFDVQPIVAEPRIRAYLDTAYFQGPEALTEERLRRSFAPLVVLYDWYCASMQRVDEVLAKRLLQSKHEGKANDLGATPRRTEEREVKQNKEEGEEANRKREDAPKEESMPPQPIRQTAARDETVAIVTDEEPKRSIPAAGEPPRVKLKTTGALCSLPPKHLAGEDPQRSLLQALVAPEQPVVARKGPCDKCDRPDHHADDCPFYKKQREDHPDALLHYGGRKPSGSAEAASAPLKSLKGATVVRQPGDGSCLFHSLSYGLGNMDPARLRADIATFVASHPDVPISGTPIRDWVLWDSGLDVAAYAARMKTGNHWGGAIELAVCARVKDVCIDVYESGDDRVFRCISSFCNGGAAAPLPAASTRRPESRTVNVLYTGRVHYDALRCE